MAAVRREPPDVVVTDIQMPPTHTSEGLKAALSIRAEFPQVAVLVLSHYVGTHQAMQFLAANPEGVGYLRKDHSHQRERVGRRGAARGRRRHRRRT
jgi:DNA-binding NarL/FixJ family response regulator